MRALIAGGGTGGHLMPALALADALVQLDSSVEPVLVGALRGVEASILPSRPYRYHLLRLAPIYRRQWWKNWRLPILAFQTRSECIRVLKQERPELVLGTGGYAAGPVLYWAYRRGLSIALQEQNAYPGLTTRWLARRARQVHLGFPEAKAHLRVGKATSVHTLGNPIIPPPIPRTEAAAARSALGVTADLPVLFVFGGSQGAARVNEAVAQAVDQGALRDLTLLWSTGFHTWGAYAHLNDPPMRIVKPFWDPIAEAYAAADVVVSRSGAMTTAELCAWGMPSILVPLPTAAANHQLKNARALADAGAAIVLPESDLSAGRLKTVLDGLLADEAALAQMRAAAAARGRPDAALRIATEVLRLVS